MNNIKIYLAESGRVADLQKDFPLYKGQFNNKLLNVYVPTSILAPQYNVQHYIGQMQGIELPSNGELAEFVAYSTYPSREPQKGDIVEFVKVQDINEQEYYLYIFNGISWDSEQVETFGSLDITGTSIKIGMIAVKRDGAIYKSKAYYMRYLKTLTYQGVEYALYERKLPKAFTKFAGQGENAPELVINVVNVDTDNSKIEEIVTSQVCYLDVMPSTMLDQDEPIETSEFDELYAIVNELSSEMPNKQDKESESLQTQSHNIVGAINEVNTKAVNLNYQINVGDAEHPSIVSTLADHETRITANAENIVTNAGDIRDIKAEQIEQNTKIANLETIVGSGEDYIGTYPAVGGEPVTLDPNVQADFEQLSSLLTAFVLTERPSVESGDVVIYHQTVEHGTDKFYKFIYSAVASAWTFYEIPSMELADNETYGIVKGSFGASDTTTPEQINVSGGQLGGIYILDGNGIKRQLASYINADHATITSNTGKINQNTLDISTNAGDIDTLETNVGKIVDGTTVVGKAEQANKDGLNRNIAETYMTQSAGATKQELIDYALPREFNDVSYVGANNQYTATIPDTVSSLYTATSTQIGDTQLFYVEKTIQDAEFQLGNKNSYTTTLYLTASIDCTVAYRVITQVYHGGEWTRLNTELTDAVDMVAGVIKKVTFSSPLNALTEVVNVESGDKIRQTFEVQTSVSTSTTFNIYSNSTYPSTFYLNTTTMSFSQGYLGELPYYNLDGTLDNDKLVFALNSTRQVHENVVGIFQLNYSGTIPANTQIVISYHNTEVRIVTPYNYTTNANATIETLNQVYQNSTGLLFTGIFKTIGGDLSVLALLDDLTDVKEELINSAVFKALAPSSTTLTQDELTTLTNNNCVLTTELNISSTILSAGTILTKPFEYSGTLRGLYINNSKIGTYLVTISTRTIGAGAQDVVLNNVAQLNGKAIPSYPSNTGTFVFEMVDGTLTWTGISGDIVTTTGYQEINSEKRFRGDGISFIANGEAPYTWWLYPTSNSLNIDVQTLGNARTAVWEIEQFRIAPASNGKGLGTSTKRIRDIYADGKIYLYNSSGGGSNVLTIFNDNGYNAKIKMGNSDNIRFETGGTSFGLVIQPITDNLTDIGQTNQRWKDIYLSGNLKDGTNSISVSSLVGKADNIIIAPLYDNTHTYAIGDIVIYNGGLYKCSTAVTTAQDFDGTKWTAITVADTIKDVDVIKTKIPAQASSSNQLADKEFVNSSIATNTANFIGTFADIPTLNAYSGTITNNDYAFVVNSVIKDNGNDFADTTALNAYDKTLLTNFDYAWVINGTKFDLYRFDIINQTWGLRVANVNKADVTLNTAYNRYKATVSGSTVTWAYEYTLNNSSFTATQWEAINSGITSSLVTQISTNAGNITNLQTDKENVSNKVTSLSSNSTDTQYPSAKCVYDLVGNIDTLLTNLNSGNGV